MSSKQPIQPSELSVLKESAEGAEKIRVTESAILEGEGVRDGNLDQADAHASHQVRNAIKEAFKARACTVITTIFWVLWVGLFLVGVMLISYIWHLLWEPDKMRETLTLVISHVAFTALGVLGKAYFGGRRGAG